MKLSAFVGVTNPKKWQFPYLEALRSFCDLADEVIVVDGGSDDGSLQEMKELSPKIKVLHSEWRWEDTVRQLPIHYNVGLDACTGDWALKLDIDYVFHENDIAALRQSLFEMNNSPSILGMYCSKVNIFNRNQCYTKGNHITAIHKRYTEGRVKIGVVEGVERCDWAVPVLVNEVKNEVPYGHEILKHNLKHTGISIYNYDCIFRNMDNCKTWFARTAKAYRDETGFPLYGSDDDNSWRQWMYIRTKQKQEAPLRSIKIEEHPKYIQDKLRNMTPDLYGFNNFDL